MEYPDWAMNDTWIVQGNLREDGRTVINKNISGKNPINSPIHISNLILA